MRRASSTSRPASFAADAADAVQPGDRRPTAAAPARAASPSLVLRRGDDLAAPPLRRGAQGRWRRRWLLVGLVAAVVTVSWTRLESRSVVWRGPAAHGPALDARDDVLGGSAVFFSYAASYFTPVRLVGVVGEDWPARAHRAAADAADRHRRPARRAGRQDVSLAGQVPAEHERPRDAGSASERLREVRSGAAGRLSPVRSSCSWPTARRSCR